MALQQAATFDQSQRMNVDLDSEGGARVYRITLERYDESLGWYTAGSLCIPLHQLPLLQQALTELGTVNRANESTQTTAGDNIIRFPGGLKAG
jgi:hypothetical protein